MLRNRSIFLVGRRVRGRDSIASISLHKKCISGACKIITVASSSPLQIRTYYSPDISCCNNRMSMTFISTTTNCVLPEIISWRRSIVTTSTTSATSNNKSNSSSDDPRDEEIRGGAIINLPTTNTNSTTEVDQSQQPQQQYTGQQKNLLSYTSQILPPEVSTLLSYSQLIQISNCITQWINSGEHRYLGAEQSIKLLQRLIVERGSRNNNEDVTFEMLCLGPIIHYLSVLYSSSSYSSSYKEGGQQQQQQTIHEFVDRILSIVHTFEEEYSVVAVDHGIGTYVDIPYKAIINMLCDQRTPHSTLAAEIVLHRFETRLQQQQRELATTNDYEWNNRNPNPTTETYNSVMSAWYKCHSGLGFPNNNNTIIGCTSYPTSMQHLLPYQYHINPCSNILYRMLELYNTDQNIMTRIKPDHISFNVAISSTSKMVMMHERNTTKTIHNRSSSVGKTCYEHLMQMLQLLHAGDHNCMPDLVTFSMALNALGHDNDREDAGGLLSDEGESNADRACNVINEMLLLSGAVVGSVNDNNRISAPKKEASEEEGEGGHQHHPAFDHDVIPRNKHFNIVLALLAGNKKSRIDEKTLQKAQHYVNIMKELDTTRDEEREHMLSAALQERENNFDNPPIIDVDDEDIIPNRNYDEQNIFSMTRSAPDKITYNTLISIAARAGKPEIAEEILDSMIEKSRTPGNEHVKPDNISFNTVLLAWSKVRMPEGRIRAEKILHRMQEMADKGDIDVRPDRTSLTTVINSIVSSVKRNNMAPFQAEQIIERMEKNEEPSLRPDTVTYTSLIKCWLESGRQRSADRAEEIINTLHTRYNDGYGECKPDTLVYNVAMNALAKSDDPNAARRAEALLNRMLDCYYAGDTDLTPTTQSFSTVMLAWARTNGFRGAKKAQQLLQTMHDMEESGVRNAAPNTICYTTCILAWKNTGSKSAGKRADALLEKMEQYEAKGLNTLKPNVITYTNAMEAWISSGQPDSLAKVEAIFDRMSDRASRGDSHSEPTTTTCNVLMKAIRFSSHPLKYQKAEELLNRMKEIQKNGGRNKPSIVTYNAFFSACAMTQGDTEDKINAFSSVLNALIELQDINHLNADAYTWPAVWKACENLLDVNRDLNWINRIFELTIKSGYVNELLFNNLRRFLPPQYLQKKLSTDKDVRQLTVHDLPREWTRNVKLGRDQFKRPSNRNRVIQKTGDA